MTAPLAGAIVARRAQRVLAERFDSETLVLHLDSNRYMRLNASGSLLWDSLEREVAAQELVDRLAAEFGLTPERATADVMRFLDALAARGLVEITQS